MTPSALGPLAVELGFLTQEALEECVQLERVSEVRRGIGRILLERGHVSELQLSYLLSAHAKSFRDLEHYSRAKTEDLVLKEALHASLSIPEAALLTCLRDQAELERKGKFTRFAVLAVARGVAKVADMELALESIGDDRRVCGPCGALVSPQCDSYRATRTCPDCGSPLSPPAREQAAGMDTKRKPTSEDTRVRADVPPTQADSGFEPKTAVTGEPVPPAPPPPVDLAEGTPFGKYRVIEEISRGGMGVVYKAIQPELDRVVALKLLLTEGPPTESEVRRFQREAHAAAHLHHPNIVSVFDVGIEEGMPFLAMEFVDGPSLASAIHRERLPLRRALEVMRDISHALDFAHKKGIVHRDIKPGNILLAPDGKPQLTDFGLAKQLDSASHLTKTGTALGTPSYMSPEQAEGDAPRVDHRSDVYGLGAVLYHLITGSAPFKGETTVQTLYKVLTQDAPRPSRVNPGIPPEVETICLKAMEKAIPRRYQSAAELAQDIERYLAGEAILAQRPTLGQAISRRLRRHRTLTIASALTLTLLGVLAWDKGAESGRARRHESEMRMEMQRIAEAQRRKFEREKTKLEEQINSALARSGGKPDPGDGTGPAPGAEPATPEELLKRGMKFKEEKHYDQAFRDFSSALAMEPKDAAAITALRLHRALCAIAQGKSDLALADLTALLERADIDSQARLPVLGYRALLRLERDDFEGATADLSAALVIDPKNLSALIHRGIALVQLGRHDAAQADLDRALAHPEAEPNDRLRILIFRALCHYGRGDYEQAVADDNLALQIDPTSTQALTNRGIAHLCRMDIDRAIADLERALSIAPSDPFATPALAAARRLQGRLAER